jgi:hypothetical protein
MIQRARPDTADDRAHPSPTNGRNALFDLRDRSFRPDHRRGSRLEHFHTTKLLRVCKRSLLAFLAANLIQPILTSPNKLDRGAPRRTRIGFPIPSTEGPLTPP